MPGNRRHSPCIYASGLVIHHKDIHNPQNYIKCENGIDNEGRQKRVTDPLFRGCSFKKPDRKRYPQHGCHDGCDDKVVMHEVFLFLQINNAPGGRDITTFSFS